jgi:antitoxin HicB
MEYRVVIERDEDGVYLARLPDLPGCATEGKTKEELISNAKEAIKAYLEALKKEGEPVPVAAVQLSV